MYIYTTHNCKATNALCMLVKREKKSFQVPAKTVKGTRDGSCRWSSNEFQVARWRFSKICDQDLSVGVCDLTWKLDLKLADHCCLVLPAVCNFVLCLSQLVFATILQVKLCKMLITVVVLTYALLVRYWSCGHFRKLTGSVFLLMT